MGKILFTPISLISGLLAGLIASKLFEFIWARFANEEAPEPDQREITWPALIVAMRSRARSSGSFAACRSRHAGRVRARDRLLAR